MDNGQQSGELREIERLKRAKGRVGCLGCTLPLSTAIFLLLVAVAIALVIRYR